MGFMSSEIPRKTGFGAKCAISSVFLGSKAQIMPDFWVIVGFRLGAIAILGKKSGSGGFDRISVGWWISSSKLSYRLGRLDRVWGGGDISYTLLAKRHA